MKKIEHLKLFHTLIGTFPTALWPGTCCSNVEPLNDEIIKSGTSSSNDEVCQQKPQIRLNVKD